MAKLTSIQWTDSTWNPWWGCSKVSLGCKNCYAETLSRRWGKDIWGNGKERQRTSQANWKLPLRWDKEASLKGYRAKVFCASMADVFDPEVPVQWRRDLFDLIRKTQHLDWLLLTKRIHEAVENVGFTSLCYEWAITWPGNAPIWLGTSVENQECFDERINALRRNPAPIGFLSVEPMLGPVDISADTEGIDWVICGAESGPYRRPMKTEWAFNLMRQCKAADIPFFMKQIAVNGKISHDLETFPTDLRVRQFPVTNDYSA